MKGGEGIAEAGVVGWWLGVKGGEGYCRGRGCWLVAWDGGVKGGEGYCRGRGWLVAWGGGVKGGKDIADAEVG